jgi:hypothetical protein
MHSQSQTWLPVANFVGRALGSLSRPPTDPKFSLLGYLRKRPYSLQPEEQATRIAGAVRLPPRRQTTRVASAAQLPPGWASASTLFTPLIQLAKLSLALTLCANSYCFTQV